MFLGGTSVALSTAALSTAALARPAAAADFDAFLQSFWPAARAKGVERDIFDRAIAGLTPDNGVPRASDRQPEFETPLQSYVQEAVSVGRVARGRAARGRTAP